MPKVRMKNSPFHKKDVAVVLRRYLTGGLHAKKSIDCWTDESSEGLEVSCNYLDIRHHMRDGFSYNKYGSMNGWHPTLRDEFFDPYISQILTEARTMRAGETRRIRVHRR